MRNRIFAPPPGAFMAFLAVAALLVAPNLSHGDGAQTAPPAQHNLAAVPAGEWGGEHVRMTIAATATTLEFDCAFGRIEEPLVADRQGGFSAIGTVTLEAGGPVAPDHSPPPPLAARYEGWTNGTEMRLRVTILTDEPWTLGNFTLGLGRRAVLEKCL